MKLKFKKGFSLVELLVVIAIIGILAAVGITAYQGYTQSAKEKAVAANHAQIVKLLNAEMAKCAGGEGVFGWDTAGDDVCNRLTDGEQNGVDYTENAASAAQIVKHINEVLNLKNPYNATIPAGAVDDTAVGTIVITCAVVLPGAAPESGCTVQSYHEGDGGGIGPITVPYM